MKILGTRTRVTAELVWVLVRGHSVVYGVIYSCQTWPMHHVTLLNQWDSISIYLSPSLDHYITVVRYIVQALHLKTRVTAKHVRGVVRGHNRVCGVIHPRQTWSMSHITLIKQWESISIHASLSLGHYTTGEVHDLSSWVGEPGYYLSMSGV